MEKYLSNLEKNMLFQGLTGEEIQSFLLCLSAKTKSYTKGSVLIHSGDAIDFVGIVLEGAVKILKDDAMGKRILLAELSSGALFAEVFACAGIKNSPVTIEATTDCVVLFCDIKKVFTTCETACIFHSRIIQNMVKLLAHKSLSLHQKIEVLSKTRLRDKILAYFQFASGGKKSFTLPLGREAMADYLSADRSALSRELSKMQKEGLISYHKNEVTVHY